MSVGLALAEAMLAARFNRGDHGADRPPHLRDRERRRHPGGRGLRGVLARRPPRPRQADRLLRQQPHPARRRDIDVDSARTWASATRPTAGTCRTWGRTSPSRRSSAPPRRRRASSDRPSLVIVRSHIGYGSPNKQDTYQAHGSPLGEDEVKRDEGGLRLAGRQDLLRARRRAQAVRGGGRARRGAVSEWEQAARRVPRRGARRRRRARPDHGRARLPDGWDERRADVQPGRRRRWPPARRRSR